MSRVKTTEEIQAEFLDHLHMLVAHWSVTAPSDRAPLTVEDRLRGLAFSICVALDGRSSSLPSFIIAPDPHPSDRAFCESRLENYYPDNGHVTDKIKGDIGGSLHDLFYSRKTE